MVRHAVLDAATDGAGGDVEGGVLTFCCALARQCFINDFVFSCTETELDRATLLKERLAAELARGNAVRASWIAAVAAYFPLLSVPGAEALSAGSWPESIAALLKQQIAEPLEEQRYRDHLPRLTPIDDDVSHSVRQQYEEHPYPRWIRLPPPGPARGINAHLARLFPFAPFHPIDESGGVDILVAGCGTGRESIETAQDFPTARVLAVDLSLASLCYARKEGHRVARRECRACAGRHHEAGIDRRERSPSSPRWAYCTIWRTRWRDCGNCCRCFGPAASCFSVFTANVPADASWPRGRSLPSGATGRPPPIFADAGRT